MKVKNIEKQSTLKFHLFGNPDNRNEQVKFVSR